MCGKYYADREFIPRLSELFKDENIIPDPELREEWRKVLTDEEGQDDGFDVNPTDSAVTISASESGIRASKMKWGFRDPYHNSLVINARSETAPEKQMFAESMRDRRCIIPASGYYEWDSARARYRFSRPDGGLVLLAGFYRKETGEDHYTILTTEANECMASVHPRMPVTIEKYEIRDWLEDEGFAREALTRKQSGLEKVQDAGQISMDIF